jgi:hypothetical protein
MRAPALLALAAAALAACRSDRSARTDSAAAASTPAATSGATPTAAGGAGGSAAAVGATDCPVTGRWAPCLVEKRLKEAGFVPAPAPDTVRHDFLSVPGRSYTLGRAELQVFVYPDSVTVARDVAALDTVRVAPKNAAATWQVRPTFIRSANLVALLISTNERQIERVQLALTAGPPQPEVK